MNLKPTRQAGDIDHAHLQGTEDRYPAPLPASLHLVNRGVMPRLPLGD